MHHPSIPEPNQSIYQMVNNSVDFLETKSVLLSKVDQFCQGPSVHILLDYVVALVFIFYDLNELWNVDPSILIIWQPFMYLYFIIDLFLSFLVWLSKVHFDLLDCEMTQELVISI